VTNYGAIAILKALPESAPSRQVRLAIAIETFRADEDGWRSAGQVLLAETASFSRRTLQRARPELIDAKLIEYEPGRGKGVLSRYRFLISLQKGAAGEPFSGCDVTVTRTPAKGRTGDAKRAQAPPVKGRTGKPGKPAVTAGQAPDLSQDAEHPALRAKALALKAEGFSSPRERGAAPDGTPRTRQSQDPGDSPRDEYGFPVTTKADHDLLNYGGLALTRARIERDQWEAETGDKDASGLREHQLHLFGELPAHQRQPYLAMARRISKNRDDADITQIAADFWTASHKKDRIGMALEQLAEARALRLAPPAAEPPGRYWAAAGEYRPPAATEDQFQDGVAAARAAISRKEPP